MQDLGYVWVDSAEISWSGMEFQAAEEISIRIPV